MPPVAAAVCEYATPTAPFGNDAVVIDGPAITLMLSAFVAVPPKLSVTFKVNPTFPAVVGVPVIAPVFALRPRPAGSGPGDNDHVYGCAPPVATAVCEYATLTSPSASDVVVIDGAATMLIDSALVADAPTLSVTFNVNPTGPAVVGVPVIAPVLALRLSPAGSGPGDRDHVYGAVPPVAAAVCEYAILTSPSANEFVEIVGADPIVIERFFVTDAPRLSVTLSVNPTLPDVVGVPVIAPVFALRPNPAGKGPGDNDQV